MDIQRKAFEKYIKTEYKDNNPIEWLNGRPVKGLHLMLWNTWQAAKAQVPEGFVLIKNDSRTVVAIENMVQQQVEASGITDDIFRLDGEQILEAMLSAQEPAND